MRKYVLVLRGSVALPQLEFEQRETRDENAVKWAKRRMELMHPVYFGGSLYEVPEEGDHREVVHLVSSVSVVEEGS